MVSASANESTTEMLAPGGDKVNIDIASFVVYGAPADGTIKVFLMTSTITNAYY